MQEEISVMRIGSGRINQNGERVKVRGYAPRTGKSLAELLKEHGKVKMIAMGDASTNNLVKAIAHAQSQLKNEQKDLFADEFAFETVSFEHGEGTAADAPATGKAITVTVCLTSIEEFVL